MTTLVRYPEPAASDTTKDFLTQEIGSVDENLLSNPGLANVVVPVFSDDNVGTRYQVSKTNRFPVALPDPSVDPIQSNFAYAQGASLALATTQIFNASIVEARKRGCKQIRIFAINSTDIPLDMVMIEEMDGIAYANKTTTFLVAANSSVEFFVSSAINTIRFSSVAPAFPELGYFGIVWTGV